MRRAFLWRAAQAWEAERGVIEVAGRLAYHHPWWGLTLEEGRAHGVPHLERQGPFMRALRERVPHYDLLKVWCAAQVVLRGDPPSRWQAGWRPRFIEVLASGRWPVLWATGEPLVDTSLAPTERIEAWVARCPQGVL